MDRRLLRGAVLTSGAALACAAGAGVPLQWDVNSSVPGPQGGIGVWNTSNSNWLNTAGGNIVWNNGSNYTAIFSGTPGTQISIGSTLVADAIQFDTVDYALGQTNNPAITLSGGSVVANVDALIRVPLASTVKLVKSGAGVLSLAGSNTLGGGISIAAGTLSFANDYSLGAANNTVSLDGGNLLYTGSSEWTPAAARQINVLASGGGIASSATIGLRRTGQLTGNGVLTKLGSGNLVIAETNSSFTGSVNVSAGTLTLSKPGAINLRPVTLAGGSMLLLDDGGSTFTPAVQVTADSSLSINRLSAGNGSEYLNAEVGNLSISAAKTLTISGSNRLGIGVSNLQLDGTLAIRDTGITVHGQTTGSGEVRFFPILAPPAPVNYGLVFDGGASRSNAYTISADAATGASAVVTVNAASTIQYGGQWHVGGTSCQSVVLLRDGGRFIFSGSARVNTLTAGGALTRPFNIVGIGASNVVELDGAFVADHTSSGTVADGLASLSIADAILVSRATGSLPVVSKADGFGGTHRAGNLFFSGTSGAKWVIATAAQQYEGGVTFSNDATIQTDADLTHIGTTAQKHDGQFQISGPATLMKTGPGSLNLTGHQGFAAGSALTIAAGHVRFMTDPGMGYVSGNYSRGADGNVTAAPTPKGTLAVRVGGSGAASVEFAAPVSRIGSLELNSGGTARVTEGSNGEKTLILHALTLSGGTLDLTHQNMVVDYPGGDSALSTIRAGLADGYNILGAHWQGSGIVSSVAAVDPTLAIGYAEASSALKISGAHTAPFGHVTVDASSVILRITRFGDANLDGKVTFGDFQKLEANFGLAGTWFNGDFNYDGVVTFADFVLLFNNYGQSIASASMPVNEAEMQSLALFAAAVPEPAGLLTWLAGAALVCRRHRRAVHSPVG